MIEPKWCLSIYDRVFIDLKKLYVARDLWV